MMAAMSIQPVESDRFLTVHLDLPSLRSELGQRGWSFADLAAASGLSNPTIGRIKRGSPVAVATAKRIAAAFDATPPVASITKLLAVAI
jgi:transcriptional regulator with XRE-family HTH domain